MTTVRSDKVPAALPASSSAIAAVTLLASQPSSTATAQVAATVCLVELMEIPSLMTERTGSGCRNDAEPVVPHTGAVVQGSCHSFRSARVAQVSAGTQASYR